MKLFFGFFSLFLLAACQCYQPNELNVKTVVASIKMQRQNLPNYCLNDSVLTFSECAQWASDSSLDLAVIRAEYQMCRAVASIKTPFPNPALGLGPDINIGPGLLQNVTPAASLGFTIPLGPRLSCQDNVFEAIEKQAFQKVVIAHRELYLNLRQAYVTCALLAHKEKSYKRLLTSLEEVQQRKMNDAFKNEVELLKNTTKTSLLNLEDEIDCAHFELTALLSTDVKNLQRFEFRFTPQKLDSFLEINRFDEFLLTHNSELASLKMEHLIADLQYKLELAKQIPDLSIGLDYGMDFDRISTLSPNIGAELPIFDRNQQAIAETQKMRDIVNLRYKKSFNDLLHKSLHLYRQIPSTYPLEIADIAEGERSGNMFEHAEKHCETCRHILNTLDENSNNTFALLELEKTLGHPLFKIDNESFEIFNP